MLDLLYGAIENNTPADSTFVNVSELAPDLPTDGYDWSEWAIAIVVLENRENGNDIVAYRNETDQVNEDWTVGTLEDAAESAVGLVNFAFEVVETDLALQF